MLSFLASAGKSALRTLLPGAINWGMNKLITSGFGQSYIIPALQSQASLINSNLTPSEAIKTNEEK